MLARLPAAMPRVVERCVLWVQARRTSALAVAGAAAALAVIVALAARSAAPVSLFDAPLHPRQTAEIAQALTLWNESFSSDAQGTRIFVSAGRRRDLLVRLALADLPHRYVPTTADVLAAPDNLLTPPQTIDDRRRSGIEGDMVAGLRRIDGVADATVVIAPAAGDAFADQNDRSPPSASVQLILQPGVQLAAATILGVRRFVAAGYPGLNPDRVTVVDGSGALLAPGAPDKAASRESRIQSNVQSALDAVFGAGVAIVRVNVRSLGSEQSVQSTRIVPHGLLDADTGREQGTVNGRQLSKERTTRHYAYDTIVEHRTTSADAPAKISVAVFLDAARTETTNAQTIGALVRAAAGADLAAGDEVVVQAVPFAAKPAVAAVPTPLSRAVVPAALILVVAALGFTFFPPRTRKAARPDPAVTGLRASLDRESPRTAAYMLSTLPRATRQRILESYGPARRASIEACFADVQRN